MDPTLIVKLLAVASLLFLVLSFGLETKLPDAFAFLQEPWLSARAMAAMFLLVPAVALALSMLFPLVPATMFALLALAVSPMPPIFPGKGAQVGGGRRYVMSLFILATAFTFVAAPLILLVDAKLLGVGLAFEPGQVSLTLAVTAVGPLVAGLVLGSLAPRLADRIVRPFALIGKGLLGLTALLALVLTAPNMWQAIGNFTLVACAILAVAALAAGHLLGGPHEGNRAALATAASLRHPGIAMGMAASAGTSNSQQVTATILIYLIVATLMGIGYDRWRKSTGLRQSG
jgi:BASS family bile acid:Na+ symporter